MRDALKYVCCNNACGTRMCPGVGHGLSFLLHDRGLRSAVVELIVKIQNKLTTMLHTSTCHLLPHPTLPILRIFFFLIYHRVKVPNFIPKSGLFWAFDSADKTWVICAGSWSIGVQRGKEYSWLANKTEYLDGRVNSLALIRKINSNIVLTTANGRYLAKH